MVRKLGCATLIGGALVALMSIGQNLSIPIDEKICSLFPPYVMGEGKSSEHNGQFAAERAIMEKKQESFRMLSSIYP
jgi:hypothetical protein